MSADSKTVVLVVEDEPLILLNAVDMIEGAGMVALEAATVAVAFDLLERRPDIRIVFTDVDLHGAVDGLELARRVRERWPHIHVVITSGHMLSRSLVMPEGSVFLPKPYSEKQVVGSLRSLAERPTGP